MPGVSDAERARRLARFRREQWEIIDKYGWTVIAVFPTVETPCVPFAYTAGLTAHGFPEFMIVGLPSATSQSLLNLMGQRVFDRAERFTHGQRIDDLLTGMTAVVVDGDPLEEMQLGQAYGLYGRAAVSVQQIVWPDRDGRYPWDDGFEYGPERQPTIGTAPETGAAS